MPDTGQIPIPWSLDRDVVIESADSDETRGLSDEKAAQRLAATGPNVLETARPTSALQVFLRQFADWLIALLAIAAIVSGIVGSWEDSLLIATIMLANALIGFVQERRAEEAVSALRRMSQPSTRVLRNGVLREISTAELVPGDVIEVASGDIVPADGRILEAVDLQVNEAALTGESLPVEKSHEVLPLHAQLAERTNMIHSGTALVRGHGRSVITATGRQTELGKIAEMLETAEDTGTPLRRQLTRLSRYLGLIVIVICLTLFGIGWLRGMPSSQMFLTAVSLAVAAIPEGLPAIITVTLALGARRMAERHSIMRRLATVETLGSVNVICTDKTGTLTLNQMRVADVEPASDKATVVEQLWKCAVLCNNAQVKKNDEGLTFDGSGTEVALLEGAIATGRMPTNIIAAIPRLKEFAFDADRKMMSSLHRDDEASKVIFAKGAAERILEVTTHEVTDDGIKTLSDARRSSLLNSANEAARRGRRMLGFAYKPWESEQLPESVEEAESDLIWLGSMGLIDPPREEAKNAIAACRGAGVRVVMITGDHAGTATAIAEDVGLLQQDAVTVEGRTLDQMSDDELASQAGQIGVYARVTPAHKIRIVKALQSTGAVVAMTGDGVNDAPALKQADIGVAMGITGTEVSKEASDMILADDNLATLTAAIKEGRSVYDNIRKFVRYLLTTNTGEIVLMATAIIWGFAALPLLPIHILWINLVTDGLPALALGFEQPEADLMRRSPRSRDEGLFAEGIGRSILGIGLLVGAICVCVWLFFASQIVPSEDPTSVDEWAYPRTAVFLTLACSQLFYVLSLQSTLDLAFSSRLWKNYRLIGAVVLGFVLQLSIVYLPSAARIFHFTPLSMTDLAVVFGLSFVPFLVGEFLKVISRIRQRHETTGLPPALC